MQKAEINIAASVVASLIGAKLIHDWRRKWTEVQQNQTPT